MTLQPPQLYATEASRGPRRLPGAVPGAPNNSVPKSLGCAMCSGCGRKAFYQADGIKLTPCERCKQARARARG